MGSGTQGNQEIVWEGYGMNSDDIDKWSEKHVGSLALTRTIVGFVNVALSLIVVAKLFGWI